MKNKFAIALAGLLALSSATFAADWRDNGHHNGGNGRGAYHQEYRGGGRDYGYHNNYRGDYGYRGSYGYRGGYGYGGGGGVYLGATPGYYSGYVAPEPYVDPYAYAAPAVPYDSYATPYADQYVGPAPFGGAIWIGGGWSYGPHGRYWVGGHWGHRR